MKKNSVLAYFFIFIAAFAYESFEEDIKDTWISVYSNNSTLIRENRYMEIGNETEQIVLNGLPKYVDIGSLSLKGVNVKSMNYNSDIINSNELLERYVGKKIFILDDTGREEVKLLSVSPQIVVEKLGGEILVDPKKEILLPKFSETPLLYPNLLIKTERISGPVELEASYLTSGIYWQFTYKFDLKSKNFETWTELRNSSGKDFNDVHLKLISGDLNSGYPRFDAKTYSSAIENVGRFSKWSDYMVYEFEKPVTLKNSSVEYVKLSESNLDYEKYYKHRFNSYSRNPSINIKLKNNLKRVVARGRVSFYDGIDYLGESVLNYLNEGEDADISIARSFEVRVESEIENSIRLSKKIYKKDVAYTVKNNKEEAIKIELMYDNLPVNWTELQSELPYEKVSDRSISFNMNLNPKQEKSFKFSYIQEN